MTKGNSKSTAREAIAVFFDAEHLKKAINALMETGCRREQIGLLASEHSVKESLGDFYSHTNNTHDTGKSPVKAFVSKEDETEEESSMGGSLFFVGTSGAMGAVVASSAVLGGALVAALSGVVAVGLIGAMAGKIIHQSDAEYLQQRVDEGHIVLFVRIIDQANEKMVTELLSAHGGSDVKVYEVPLPS